MTPPTPPTIGSGRNSTSTSGRTSLGGFLSLNRFRHSSDPHHRQGSPGIYSKSNSFAISREALVIPEREEGDTPSKYLERLQATVSRSLIAGILSKSSDPFAQAVLRSYCRKFAFFGEPIDMSLRKFLLEAELPKETQQVDRVIQAFADRYHECNPGIFTSPDQAYIVAFSLMMLHTDAFNKNNKRKMQKQDYIKNTSGQNVSDDVLACFYDNICYTPFIHFDEEVDVNGERLLTFKTKKSKLKGTMPDPVRKNSGPIDPYALICDGKLDVLRPSFKDSITMEDPYSYLGTSKALDLQKLQRAFVNFGILQIISARSRPAAFESQATRDNPNEAPAGLVDLKVTKVGLLWRKATKRKKARSPWQEWGAILTGSQLYLFRNIAWMKSLMAQQHAHLKQESSLPVIFKPAIQEFKPDALIKTDDAVALLDASYNKHKDAFTIVRHGGQEEVLLAENESEMNEWIALINYAAAFRSAGVRIRGFVGGSDHDSNPRSRGRLASTSSASIQTSSGPVEITQKQSISPQLARQVMAARRQIMLQTIVESEREIADASRNLENMLRNARHLAILAPIQPKTREGVMHAAARMDAMLKWVRRDIWRTKSHKDILALDLEEDCDGPDRIAPSSSISPPPTVTVRRASGIQRLNSKATSNMSPPQSPQSPAHSARQGTISSTEGFLAGDVFKTPPEHAQQAQTGEPWKLPPLDMDVLQPRLSVASAVQSLPRKHSTAGMSSTSSMQDVERHLSTAASDTPSRPGRVTPTPSFEYREREALALARDGLTPTITGTTASSTGASQAFDFAPSAVTPESTSKTKSGRRSLHRTLRDRDHEPSSIHRHRKGKDSASTVKSEGGDELAEGAPRLERATGKFIVHGKQASVITFGGDWAEEKLRLERKLAARAQAHSNLRDSDESGPDANLRSHVAQAMAAAEDMAGYATDSTAATAPSRRPSETHTYNLAMDGEASATNARGIHETAVPTEQVFSDLHQQPDAFTLGPEYGHVSPSLASSDGEGVESYFDIGSNRSRKTTNGKSKVNNTTISHRIPSSSKGDNSENVPPEQLPLPTSPRINDDTNLFPRYIGDEELRQLASRPTAQAAES